jgi:hypothetical protein
LAGDFLVAGYVVGNKITIWKKNTSINLWEFQIEFIAPAPAEFGFSVAIYQNSSTEYTIIVGGPADNGDVGAAWVYRGIDTIWTEQKLIGSNPIGSSRQGVSVAVYGDTVAFSGTDDNSYKGATWVFVKSGPTWTEQAKLVGTGTSLVAYQGYNTVLYDNTLAIGSHQDTTNGSGSILIYTRSELTWTQEPTLYEPSIKDFGKTLCMNSNTIVTKGSNQTSFADNSLAIFTGSSGSWTLEQKSSFPDNYSDTIAIDNVNDIFCIGADGILCVYVFKKINDVWKITQLISPFFSSNRCKVALNNGTIVTNANVQQIAFYESS